MNTEFKIDIESFFNSRGWASSSQCVSKWKSIVSRTICIDDEKIYEKICVFIEKYSALDEHIRRLLSPYSPLTSSPLCNNILFPSWYIELPEVINRFDSIFEGADFARLSVIGEYYNILTNKKGIKLEGDILIEEGKIIKNKNYYSIISKIEDMVDNEIKYLTNLEYRKVVLRKDKLDSL